MIIYWYIIFYFFISNWPQGRGEGESERGRFELVLIYDLNGALETIRGTFIFPK